MNGTQQLSQLAPIPVGVPGSAPQSIPRSDTGMHPSMTRTDSGVHMIRETQHTVLSGGQQVPLIMTQIDPEMERLEFRWDNDTLRFSDKNQKAIDLLRTKCLSLKSMVLCDGKLYEIMRGNFERADRRSVIRTTVNSKVTIHYLLANYDELLFG